MRAKATPCASVPTTTSVGELSLVSMSDPSRAATSPSTMPNSSVPASPMRKPTRANHAGQAGGRSAPAGSSGGSGGSWVINLASMTPSE